MIITEYTQQLELFSLASSNVILVNFAPHSYPHSKCTQLNPTSVQLIYETYLANFINHKWKAFGTQSKLICRGLASSSADSIRQPD